MKFKQWKWKQWVALSSVLLVLVTSSVAYYVYVPKLRELKSLEKELQSVKKEQNALLSVPIPAKITEQQRKSLAQLIPTTHEQPQFLKLIRQAETASGATLISVTFDQDDPNSPEAALAAAAAAIKPNGSGTAKTKLEDGVTEMGGKLSVEGSYAQVRQFIEKFSKSPRLVTFKSWSLQSDLVADVKATDTVSTPSSGSNTPPINLPTVPTIPTPTPAPATKVFTDADIKNPYFQDRTPIYTEKEVTRVLEFVKSRYPTYRTQQEKDMANLEMQHTFNRYTAGLLGLAKAPSILDQEYANRYLDGANTNIKQVLGLVTDSQSAGTATPAGGGSNVPVNTSTSLMSLLNLPDLTISGNQVKKYKVKVDINFAIYTAPSAQEILPPADPMQTYEPTYRTNPVESW